MTAKISSSADGTKVNIGNAAEDALQIDSTAKTIKALAPFTLAGNGPVAKFTGFLTTTSGQPFAPIPLTSGSGSGIAVSGSSATPTKAGWYQCNVQAGWGAVATGLVQIIAVATGETFYAPVLANATQQQRQNLSFLQYFNGTTDSLVVQASQNSGGALNCTLTGQMVLVREP
jgi:hypothetical protein